MDLTDASVPQTVERAWYVIGALQERVRELETALLKSVLMEPRDDARFTCTCGGQAQRWTGNT